MDSNFSNKIICLSSFCCMLRYFYFSLQKGGGSVTPSGAGSNHTTPERERYAAAVAQQPSERSPAAV